MIEVRIDTRKATCVSTELITSGNVDTLFVHFSVTREWLDGIDSLYAVFAPIWGVDMRNGAFTNKVDLNTMKASVPSGACKCNPPAIICGLKALYSDGRERTSTMCNIGRSIDGAGLPEGMEVVAYDAADEMYRKLLEVKHDIDNRYLYDNCIIDCGTSKEGVFL